MVHPDRLQTQGSAVYVAAVLEQPGVRPRLVQRTVSGDWVIVDGRRSAELAIDARSPPDVIGLAILGAAAAAAAPVAVASKGSVAGVSGIEGTAIAASS